MYASEKDGLVIKSRDMANNWVYQVTVLLLILSGITEAESSMEQNDRDTHDALQSHFAGDEAKRPEKAWKSAPLSSSSSQQKRKRTTPEEDEEGDEGSEISAAYLRALAGDDDEDEKRARSSFRGDLGKRMMRAGGYMQAPGFWAADADDEKRFKVSSRFRGDLGKRAKSSFRGDLGKRFQSRHVATPDDFTDARIPSYKFHGDKTGQTNAETQYKDVADSGSSRPFPPHQMRTN